MKEKDIFIYKSNTHCMAKIQVILFWKVELSPT